MAFLGLSVGIRKSQRRFKVVFGSQGAPGVARAACFRSFPVGFSGILGVSGAFQEMLGG